MRRSLSRLVLTSSAVVFLSSCGGGSNAGTTTQTMTKFAGDNQTVAVGVALATKPAVKIVNQDNAGVAGVTVTFAVASGGGSATGASATTGNDGVATVGSWTLGAAAGTNTMTASAAGVTGSPVTFTATATAAAPVPATLTKQAGDAQTAAGGTAVTIPPSVKVVDAAGNPMNAVPVFFAVASGGGTITGGSSSTSATINTNALGIAAVTSWSLGPAAGANTLTATTGRAGVTGDPATFTATASAPAFNPIGNTAISGALSYGSINIPAGVTVTLSADATITVTGSVTIAGSIVGDCKNLTLTITGTLTSTGSINNSCSTTPTTPPSLTIVATGGYTLTSGTYTFGGPITISNDASLNDGAFAAPPAPLGNRASLKKLGPCVVGAMNFIASPFTATDGNNGQFGTDGADGSQFTLQCNSEIDFQGGALVHGQYGGKGGNGTHVTTGGSLATGGKGGLGGNIRVRALGAIQFAGAATNIQSGSGGAGGTATATSTGVGSPGPSATATGGSGTQPGNILVQSKGGSITIAPGSLTLTMGDAGAGGFGTATAGNGQTSPTCPAGAGGAANGTGGNGGTVPDRQLTATGSVGGAGNITIAGGQPGIGGAGTSTAGNGGAGSATCIPGGIGGVPTGRGGTGGNALLRDQLGALLKNGGNGGLMTDLQGNGGAGYIDCVAPLQAGGNGGAGASAAGGDGLGGTGLANGTRGGGVITNVGNGANGGNGMGPGTGGGAGSNGTTAVAPAITGSFGVGVPGNWCPLTKTAVITITNPAQDDPSNHESVLLFTGSRSVNILNTGAIQQLFPGIPVLLFCSFNTVSGVITCTQSGFTYMARTITSAVFTGTWNPATQQLVGDLVLTIQGQANTVKYHIVDP